MRRAWYILLSMFAALLGACASVETTGVVGDPSAGFTFQFSDKWRFEQHAKPMPAFVDQAVRFVCDVDKCGRRAVGVGVYGKLADSDTPRISDVIAIVDQLMNLNGRLRKKHVNAYPIGAHDGWRVRFNQHVATGQLALARASFVSRSGRYLMLAVVTTDDNESLNQTLLAELEASLKVPPQRTSAAR